MCPATTNLPTDACTQSNWQDVVSEHVDFDWSLDFATQSISGSATHTLVVRTERTPQVVYVSSAYIHRNRTRPTHPTCP